MKVSGLVCCCSLPPVSWVYFMCFGNLYGVDSYVITWNAQTHIRDVCPRRTLRNDAVSPKISGRLPRNRKKSCTSFWTTLFHARKDLPIESVSREAANVVDEEKSLITTGRRAFASRFRFPLDDWQLQAGGAICAGRNVILSAPTGAGKTVVGEMALLHAFNQGRNGIYTTPLKALSNQKYTELCQTFGRSNTGLSTGDISINKGARITVMTTEVYRNMAWRSSTKVTTTINGSSGPVDASVAPIVPLFDAANNLLSSGNAATNRREDFFFFSELATNSVVVLDEFHYMGYSGRGGVWEESIITSPLYTQIIGLSATLSNAPALAAWMESVTGKPTCLIQVPDQQRPVPLRYLYATKDGLYPLFRDPDAGPGSPKGLLGYRGEGIVSSISRREKTKNGFGVASASGGTDSSSDEKLPRGLQVNPALKAAAARRLQKVNRRLEQQLTRGHFTSDDAGNGRGVAQSPKKLSPREERKERDRLLRQEMRRDVPSMHGLLTRLDKKHLLPAIFFIFSRNGCDNAAQSILHFMKGPRDPNRMLDDELDQFGYDMDDRPQRKYDTRQRGSRRNNNQIEDGDGRTFRASSSYVREEVLVSLYNGNDGRSLNAENINESSPLSSSNWDFYANAGLLKQEQIQEVASIISVFNEDNPEIAFEDDVAEQFLFGVGSHHAGMLPAHKSFVEFLYRNQLMKAVFATETLAAGINMPARTTVICALAKRGDGSSMNLLETSNMLQMAGRAGRRGMDTDGTCVVVATPFETHEDAAKILTDPIKPIRSQFSPSYSLALNLIARGEGKLDVARQLVSKSFAMWEKRDKEGEIAAAVESIGDGVNEVLHDSARERFFDILVEELQSQVERRSAKFDISRLQSLLDVLRDREALKKASKSFVSAVKMLELEEATLGYLEKEYNALQKMTTLEGSDFLAEMINDEEKDLLDQIRIQRDRAAKSGRDISKHPFSFIALTANSIMEENKSAQAQVLRAALGNARSLDQGIPSSEPLSPNELSILAKGAITAKKKARKLENSNPGLDTSSLAANIDQTGCTSEDSLDDMLAIVKTLVAYGCLITGTRFDKDNDFANAEFRLTPAGVNVGMLGFENSLWSLVAMGGAWDVVGASSKLDDFRAAIGSFDRNGERTEAASSEQELSSEASGMAVPSPQDEAKELVSLLRSMTPGELAGYVSSLVSDGSRGGPPVVELFQGLSSIQQRVIQKSLFVMERLMEVQKQFAVDTNTQNCGLDISGCKVVTAWANGCSWSDALRLSGAAQGDLVRTLSRVLDAVRQLGNLPYRPARKHDFAFASADEVWQFSPGLDPEVRRLCREAAKAINRYPLKDPLALETPDDLDEIEGEEESVEAV